MTHTPPDPHAVAWTEDELDDALTALGSFEPSARQLTAARNHVLAGRPREPAPASGGLFGRAPQPRRRRHLIVVGAVAMVCAVGGGVAAATGMFDQQVNDAFTSVFTQPYILDPHTAVERVSIATPDGGDAQFWTATTDGVTCVAALLDDPGVRSSSKPYFPQANCSPGDYQGERYQSAKAGTVYQLLYGQVRDTNVVDVTFVSPGDAATFTTPVHDGYFMIFVPAIPEPGGSYGQFATRPDGSRATYSDPNLLPPGTPG